MMTQLQNLSETYDNIMSLRDPRTENWLFAQTPLEPIVILIAYSLFLHFGRKIMFKRQAFELKTFMYLYNFIQIIASFYVFYETLVTATVSKYSLLCQQVDYSNNPLPLRIARVSWLYYITKLLDLTDTVIFVLRKKQNQMTFLHLYHHMSMVLITWNAVVFVPGGQLFFHPLLNSFVHTIMYGYYGLSALGPKVQKYLWWKRYITIMQLTQFYLLLIYTIVNYFSGCSLSKGWDIFLIYYLASITILFHNFYRQSYNKKSKEIKATQSISESRFPKLNGIQNDKKHNE